MSLRDWIKRRLASRAEESDDADDAPAPGGDSEPAEGNALDPFDPFPEPVVLEITDVIDLHTFAPRDVGRVVEAYLAEARRAGFRSVRIIHGKGRGVQRETVRRVLSRTPFVAGYTDAPPQAGGLGATIAHLKQHETGDESRPD